MPRNINAVFSYITKLKITNKATPVPTCLMNTFEDYHVHANFNDHSSKDLSIQNALDLAKKIGLKTVAFTEHVRETSDWIPKYLEEIESCKNSYSGLNVISGFEAKILKDGKIDCSKDYSKDYFIIASFHSVFSDKQVWLEALKVAIKNHDVDVIGHIAPEPTFDLAKDELEELALLIKQEDKIVELNAKYHRPPERWLRVFQQQGVRFHLGSDAHSLQEIGQFEGIKDLISIANGEK